MSEIRIKKSSIFREFVIWLALLVVAFFTNIYAIIAYGGQWSELISQLHVVFILSIVFYVVAAVIRGIVYGVKLFMQRRRQIA